MFHLLSHHLALLWIHFLAASHVQLTSSVNFAGTVGGGQAGEQLDQPVMRSWHCLLLLYLAYRRNKEKESGARGFLRLWYTKIQSRSTGRRGCTNFCVCDFFTLKLANFSGFKCICDGFSKNYVYHKHKFNFGNAPLCELWTKRNCRCKQATESHYMM